jgi:hypothetical protein
MTNRQMQARRRVQFTHLARTAEQPEKLPTQARQPVRDERRRAPDDYELAKSMPGD